MKCSKILNGCIVFLTLLGCAHLQKEPVPPAHGKSYLKWTVKSTGFKITTESLEKVEASEPMLPPGIGDHTIVASYKGKKIASFPFALPKTSQTETAKQIVKENEPPSNFEPLEKNQPPTRLLITIWIPFERNIDLLSILDPKGNLLLSEKISGQ